MSTKDIQFPKSFPEIRTKRLHLKQIQFSDADDLHIYLSDQEVKKYIGIPPYTKIEETYNEIKWYDKIFKTKTGIRWGISFIENPAVIGSCGFLNMSQSNVRAEIGYELNKNYWRKGIVSEALSAIIKYGFEEINLNRVEALIEPENIT